MTTTFAHTPDIRPVQALLAAANLPFEDVAPHLKHFITAHQAGSMIGVIGVEPLGTVGLLRSLAVAENVRKQNVGTLLCEQLESYASQLGISSLYLLTTTAEHFFEKRGYTRVERNAAPAAVQATHEFQSLCPSSAVCMMKNLNLLSITSNG